MRRSRITALATLAMLDLFTLAAGVTVARMLPPRLAALHIPVAAARPVVHAGTVLNPVPAAGYPPALPPAQAAAAGLPTAAGLAALVAATLPGSKVGPRLGVQVADAGTGEVLYSENAQTPATPASRCCSDDG